MKQIIFIYVLTLLSMSIFAQVQLGGTADYTEIEDDGTIKYVGEAKVWNDFVVPMTSVKVPELDGDPPKYERYYGKILEWNFIAGKLSEVGLTIQMPHDWDGSTIYPHIHWSPEPDGSGVVVWLMDYVWVNYDVETIPKIFENYAILTAVSPNLTKPAAYEHRIAKFNNANGITPAAGDQDGISSILLIRLYRDAGEGSDTYTAGAFALSFDIHYRSDTAGSREEYDK